MMGRSETIQDKLHIFHRAFNHPIGLKYPVPSALMDGEKDLRRRLIQEEFKELMYAISNEEDECENACWITCIAINPGAKNSMNGTPKTSDLSFPIAKEMTNKNNIAVTIGPIIVCPNTFKNLNVSFTYNEYAPTQLMPNLLIPIWYLLFNSTMSYS